MSMTFVVSLHQFLGGKGKAAHPDVVTQREAAEHGEHPLEMKR